MAVPISASKQPKHPPKHPTIPDYLLCDILAHLDTFDLLHCRSVCHFWKYSTQNLTRLRLILFTQPPSPSPCPPIPQYFSLHPVLRRLDYCRHPQMYFRDQNAPIKALSQRLHFRHNDVFVAESAVVEAFATAPAVREVVVRMCGAANSVVREEGVRVWDLMVGLDELVKDRESSPVGRCRLAWDHRLYPFAGFRVVAVGGDKMVLKPEFHNLPAFTRGLSGCRLEEPLLLTFDEDEVEEG